MPYSHFALARSMNMLKTEWESFQGDVFAPTSQPSQQPDAYGPGERPAYG